MRRPLVAVTLLFGLLLAPSCARRGPREATLDVGDAQIHYVVAGEGHAVVLLHGWALNLHEWDDQIAALSPHYRVIALDRRGYGESTGFADPSADPGDVRAILDTLHIRSAVIVGHSAGADVATRFAAAMPGRVDALVLYGGGEPLGFPVPPDTAGPLGGFDMRQFAREYGVDSLMHFLEGLPMFRPGPDRTPERDARVRAIVAGYAGRDLLEDHPQSGRFPPARLEEMKTWHMPVLFISGTQERARWQMVADSLVKWLPGARKVLISGGGHGVHIDEPARFDAALLAFLREVYRGR
jgi:3-oxoadipate enol-lactonase